MQPTRKFRVIPQSYQAKKGHGSFGMNAHYYDEDEHEKKPKDRSDWFYSSINRYIQNTDVKCFVYNHNTHSTWLYEKLVPEALIDKDNRDMDYKLKNGEPTSRCEWHTMVIFD
jgi:hypothetical protein